MADYSLKIKEIYDSLGSINGTLEEDEMVEVCLRGLAETSKRTARARQGACMHENIKMLCMNACRPHGRDGCGGSAHNGRG